MGKKSFYKSSGFEKRKLASSLLIESSGRHIRRRLDNMKMAVMSEEFYYLLFSKILKDKGLTFCVKPLIVTLAQLL